MSIKGLSKEDRDFAMSRKAWAVEMNLNFSLAYKITEKMDLSAIAEDERILKLAVFAELAGHNPEPLYNKYVQVSKNKKSVHQIMAKLVRRSRNPLSTLRRFENELKSNPELLASLYLEIFARTHDYHMAQEVLKSPRLRATPSGTVFNRFVILRDFRKFETQISHTRLAARSDAKLKSNLKIRLSNLKKLDGYAQRTINMGDWTLQLATLDAVARENQRLANDIKSLPMPHRLNPAQKAEYSRLVAQQALPYNQKAQQVVNKIEELWGKSSNVDTLISEYQRTTGSLKNVISMELRALMSFAPRSQRNSIASALTEKGDRPTISKIEQARKSVQESPFNVSRLEHLKTLEERAGRDTEAGYFQARVSQLQTGGSK